MRNHPSFYSGIPYLGATVIMLFIKGGGGKLVQKSGLQKQRREKELRRAGTSDGVFSDRTGSRRCAIDSRYTGRVGRI